MLAVLRCLDASRHQFHVFGFNWSRNMHKLHQMEAEEILISDLLTRYSARLHPSPCMNRFSCDPLCDKYQYFRAESGHAYNLTLAGSICK
jgi:hypothetical protein